MREILNNIYCVDDIEEMKQYANYVWNILTKSYEYLGGFKTYSNIDEMVGKTSRMELHFTKGVPDVVLIYRSNIDGFKLVGCGTLGRTPEQVEELQKVIRDSAINYSLWKWAEVSGPMEKIYKMVGGNPIPNKLAPSVLLQSSSKFNFNQDFAHYSRIIGGERINKVMYGYKNEETYHKAENIITKELGLTMDKWRGNINELPPINESKGYLNLNGDPMIAYSMCVLIQFDNMWDEYGGINELPDPVYLKLKKYENRLKECKHKTPQINAIINSCEYMFSKIKNMQTGTLEHLWNYIVGPAYINK